MAGEPRRPSLEPVAAEMDRSVQGCNQGAPFLRALMSPPTLRCQG
jgi:hypothetical protein